MDFVELLNLKISASTGIRLPRYTMVYFHDYIDHLFKLYDSRNLSFTGIYWIYFLKKELHFVWNYEYPMDPAHSKIPLRVVIYPKDVENITGLGDRAARKLIQKIKTALGKSKTSFVTVQEFCIFTGIPEELIKEFLK